MDDLACELGCKVGSLSSTYLGMPLGLFLILWQLGIVLRKYFIKDWLYGSANISLRAGELL